MQDQIYLSLFLNLSLQINIHYLKKKSDLI